jgi:chemotaxis protein MotB
MSEHQTEIVIIKRKGGHEGEHHGGAWKIAFADFMTAMMAFFLVLWIINATDKDTKTIIARYFNPVKLENPARARKGVHGMDASKVVSDENSGEQTEGADTGPPNNQGREQKGPATVAQTPAGAPPKKDETPTPGAETHPAASNAVEVKPTMSEAALFSDPYRSLDKIVGGREATSAAASPDTGADEPAREAGATSIEAFRDPFKPVGPGAIADSPSMETDAPLPPAATQRPDLEPQKKETANATPLGRATPSAAVEPPSLPESSASPTPSSAATLRKPSPSATPSPPAAASSAAIAAQVTKELLEKLGASATSETSPAIEVRETSEGLLISLTDRLTYSMFAVGSAEPRPELIRAMDQIAAVLKTRPGNIVLRGHTDARPYKGGAYDNWRLSSARAQMAYYMMTRAGLPEARVERVEGHADRTLRDPAHPMAAENRRIEILLREPKT